MIILSQRPQALFGCKARYQVHQSGRVHSADLHGLGGILRFLRILHHRGTLRPDPGRPSMNCKGSGKLGTLLLAASQERRLQAPSAKSPSVIAAAYYVKVLVQTKRGVHCCFLGNFYTGHKAHEYNIREILCLKTCRRNI